MKVFAWLGAAVSMAALGYLAYFYLVTLRSPAGDTTAVVTNIASDVALFSAFALHHSIFARTGAKQALGALIPAPLERAVYVWIASLLTIALCIGWQPIAGMVYELTGTARFVAWFVQVAGAALVLRAARVIDPLELAGIHQAARRPTRLVLRIVGPFRTVRHPIYLGWMLLVFGTPTMTMNRLVFATVSSLYLILAIPWEERSLVAVHGDRYREYQRAVRWRVVPGLW